MIYIISGDAHSGKTRRIKELYKQWGGDGVISEKIFLEHRFVGYYLTRLSTDEKLEAIYKKDNKPSNWVSSFENVRFSFKQDRFNMALRWLEDMMQEGVTPIYIDEIGRVEIEKSLGFHSIIDRLVESELDIYIVIRESNIKSFVAKYNVTNCSFL